MTSYIRSEFYRILHNKWTYLFIAICSALLVSSNIVLAAVKHTEPDFGYANTSFSIANFISSISVVYILCIMVASMIFGNEHNNHTMKNSVSYGISRGTIYFGKLIVEIIYAIAAFVIITGFHVGSTYLLLEHSNLNEFNELFRLFLVCIPLLLFALAATNCFVFIIEGSGAATGAAVGLLVAFPIVNNYLGMKFVLFRKLSEILPWNIIGNMSIMDPYRLVLPWSGNAGYYNPWLYGILQMVLISLIGYVIFRKKEIK